MPLPPVLTPGYTGLGELFTVDGKILLVDGELAVSSRCCCTSTGCGVCDAGTTPAVLTVEVTANPNIIGGGGGCAVDCSDWVAAFALPLLDQATIDAMYAVCAALFDAPGPAAGCWYGRTTGLPCGAVGMTAQIVANGADLQVAVRVCYPTGSLTLTYNCTGRNCLATIDGTAKIVGSSSAGTPPCDFLMAVFMAITKITAS